MQFDTLEIFCDLVETRSFTLTARKHFISQPAVSQRIRQLEEELQVRLVERGSGPIQPTRLGQIIYDGCKSALKTWGTTLDQVKTQRGKVAAVVRVGTIYSVGLYELPPILKEFIRANRDIKVHLEYVRDSRIYQAIMEDGLDLGVVAFPRVQGDLAMRPLGEDELVIAAAPDHPLMQGEDVPIERLDGERMISFEGDVPTRKVINDLLEQGGVTCDVVSEYDNIETIKRVLELGDAFSILPMPALHQEIVSGTLLGLSIRGRRVVRNIGVVYRRSREMPAAACRLLDALCGAVPDCQEG